LRRGRAMRNLELEDIPTHSAFCSNGRCMANL
jgi:hypothetical protein